ncbi:MAG: carbohydrate-binding domain-containing protein [Emergencia sp.]
MLKKSMCCALSLALCAVLSAGCGNEVEKEPEADTSDTVISGVIESKYTNRDLDWSYAPDEAQKISLAGESCTITEAGIYVLTGSLDDGQIIVDAGDQDKVQLVLDGVDIACSSGPAILVENADKTFITLAEGSSNKLSDGSSVSSSEDQPWGALFSKDDLTINGPGDLTVTGNYENGIVSKDDLRITGGKISVTAVEDGIRGRNSVSVYSGEITIEAGGDGIKANNDEDEGKGWVSIDGGTVTVKGVTSQGIDAYYAAQMTGGTVRIDSQNEGIQGMIVYIMDGNLSVTSQDDCLNATDSSRESGEAAMENVLLEIAGGELQLSSAAGDGLDSNGDLNVSGGTTVIQGSSGGAEVPIDYNGTGTISGGTVLAAGNIQMGQNFGSDSEQCSILCSASGSAGDEIVLTDEDGKEIAGFKAERSFSGVLISTPLLEEGKSYTLRAGDTEKAVELTEKIYSEGGLAGGGRGGFGGQKPEDGGMRQDKPGKPGNEGQMI